MAYFKYKDFHFHRFLDNQSPEDISAFADEMSLVLKQNADFSDFSKNKFVDSMEKSQNDSDRLKHEYFFEVIKDGFVENWSIQAYFGQIPFLEGGVVSNDGKTIGSEDLARHLLENNIADRIVYSSDAESQIKKINFLRKIFNPQNRNIYGDFCKIYVWHKLHTIIPLGFYLITLPKELNPEHFHFAGFMKTVNQVLSKYLVYPLPDKNVFIKFSLNKDKYNEFSNYIGQCDKVLKERLSLTEINSLFDKVNTTPEVWFGK